MFSQVDYAEKFIFALNVLALVSSKFNPRPDIDECENDNICPLKTFCSNTFGSYECVCTVKGNALFSKKIIFLLILDLR